MTDAGAYAFRDPRPLGGAVVVWEYIYLVAVTANVVGLFLEFQAYGQGALPLNIESLTAITRLASFGLYLICAFLFLKWTYRATANARTLRPSMRATPGWAIGWYLVPIAFLWKPFEYFKETWEVSHNPTSPAQVDTPGILRWWWAFWLISSIASNIGGQLALRFGSDPGVAQVSDGFELASEALTVPLIFIVVRLVRTLSAKQYEAHTSGSASVFS